MVKGKKKSSCNIYKFQHKSLHYIIPTWRTHVILFSIFDGHIKFIIMDGNYAIPKTCLIISYSLATTDVNEIFCDFFLEIIVKYLFQTRLFSWKKQHVRQNKEILTTFKREAQRNRMRNEWNCWKLNECTHSSVVQVNW